VINFIFVKDESMLSDKDTRKIIRKMTLEEKIAQLQSLWINELLEDGDFSREKAKQLLKNGIGEITRLAGASCLIPIEFAKLGNKVQRFLVNETRLGIPAIFHDECLSGLMARGATIFPQIISLASSWDPDLVKDIASEIRGQMRLVGIHQGLAPVLDVARDPRWGRVEETFGEDPYLVAIMGAHYIKGLQGDDLKQGVIATAKHFVAHGFPEGGRNTAPAHILLRELMEIFAYPFEVAVKYARVFSIMPAYHEIDGIPCHASKWLLNDLLRKELSFEGIIVSDYFGISQLFERHKVAKDKKEAAKLAFEAGIDIELPSRECYSDYLVELVREKVIPEKLIDDAVFRILKVKSLLGLFDNPFIDIEKVPSNLDAPISRELALRAARESIILLKNNGILPLPKDIESLAVIGPNADSWRNMIGDYSYPAHIESFIDMIQKGLLKLTIPKDVAIESAPIVTVLQAIKNKVSPKTEVYYAKGCELIEKSEKLVQETVEVAKKSKVVILVLGERAGLSLMDISGESRDQADIGLTEPQEELFEAIYETGVPIVLVLINGRPLSIGSISEKAFAIIEAWYPGEEGGTAIADVLFGDYNPGGKFPITVPRAVGQIPIYYNQKPTGRYSHWWKDYVFEKAEPLYPFGYGLSYTEFNYSNLRIEPLEVLREEEIKISFKIKNVGKIPGDEVVQLYVCDEYASVTRPVKQLVGFKRISLKPNEEKTVTFVLPVDLLAFYDKNMKLVIEPGVFKIMIGSSSEDIRLLGEFKIIGDKRLLVERHSFFSGAIVSESE
jgi:beta-glucosidase